MENKSFSAASDNWLASLQDVTVLQEEKPLFFEFSALIKPSCVHLITGPNGVGKSSLLRHLQSAASISVSSSKPSGRLSGKIIFSKQTMKLEYLPQLQNTHCFLPMNIQEALEWVQGPQEIEQLIYDCGLVDKTTFKRAWNSASGGERMRALLARALLRTPRLLLLDEPLNHLDEAGRNSLEMALHSYLEIYKDAAIVLVSHQQALCAERWNERLQTWQLLPKGNP